MKMKSLYSFLLLFIFFVLMNRLSLAAPFVPPQNPVLGQFRAKAALVGKSPVKYDA